MKSSNGILTNAWFAVFITVLGCGPKNNVPSPEEVQLNKLNATWAITSVMKDGVAETGYDNLKLTLSGSNASKTYTYAVTGRPDKSPWPAGGTWTFGNNVSLQIVRDKGSSDELPMTYSITGNILTLQFQFSNVGYPSGKTSAASGNWSFVFAR